MPIQVPLSFQIIPGGNVPAVAPLGQSVNANTTLLSKVEQIFVDTSSYDPPSPQVVFTISLPANPVDYESKVFKDVGGQLVGKQCAVAGNGHNLEQDNGSFAATYTMDQNYQVLAWRYSAALGKWVRTSSVSSGGGGGPTTVLLAPTTYGSETYTPVAAQENIWIDGYLGDVRINLPTSPAVNAAYNIYTAFNAYYDEIIVAPGNALSLILIDSPSHPAYDNDTSLLRLNAFQSGVQLVWVATGSYWFGRTLYSNPSYLVIHPVYTIGPPMGPYTATLPRGDVVVGLDGSDPLLVGFTLTLPNDIDGTKKIIKDISGTAAASNIVLNPTSGNIEQFAGGYAAGLTMNANGDSVSLLKTSLGWRLV
jgi:hypothetical protein